MGLIIDYLPKLPDELVEHSWVKEVDVSNQDGTQQDNFYGIKLEHLKPGHILDHIDIKSTIPLDTQFGTNIEYNQNSSFVVKGRQDFVSFSWGNVSEKAQELAAQITEYPVGVAFSIDGLSMDQLANLVGGIGKEVDRAFAAGEISEQEYADLNKGLDTYTDFMAEKNEKQNAAFAVMKQTAAATRAMVQYGASEEEMTDYSELVREKWQEKVSAYLEENAYDRTTLNQMILAIRTGKTSSFCTMV